MLRSLRGVSWAVLVVALVGTWVGLPALRAADAKPARILYLTQSAGFKHGSVNRKEELSPSEIAMKQLGEKTGLFTVDCTQNAKEDFTIENLKKYDIVMFYTTGNLPVEKETLEYFFNTWLKQKGHGFIGVHSSTDTYKDTPLYWDIVGGTFNGHPWGAGETVTITVHDTLHPGTKPYGAEFEIKDEIYQYKNFQAEKVKVLMSLNMAKCKTKKPYHVPVAWVKTHGEGKLYYNNLGHNEATWKNPVFLDSLIGAVKWITNQEAGDATPNPQLSAAQEEKAKTDVGQ